MSLSLQSRVAALPEHLRTAWLMEMGPQLLHEIQRGAWWWTARPEQLAPPGDWFVWLIMAGRGFGKSRIGAEWIIDRALHHPVDADGNRTEWLVIAQNLIDARSICIEGVSGLKAALKRHGLREGRDYVYRKAPRLLIEFATGQLIYVESADDADVGRGYNAAGAWLDEAAKWRYLRASWLEGIMPSLRAPLIGDHPRVCVTTTPKPLLQIITWARTTDGSVHLTRGSTFDNRQHLSSQVLAEFERAYLGTTVGRQELMGELLDDVEGALWRRAQLDNDRCRLADMPDLASCWVGMDPNATGGGDLTGLVCTGRGENGDDYVLGDWSSLVTGHAAAMRAWEMVAHFNADGLVVEVNFAKAWLLTVLRDAYKQMQQAGVFPPGGDAPIRTVVGRVNKRLRAQPVASRHEQHRAHVVDALPDLEDELCTHDFGASTDSPDRMDAMVYAELSLIGGEGREMQIAVPGQGMLSGAAAPGGLLRPDFGGTGPFG